MKILFSDYESYKSAQIAVNKRKIKNVWIDDFEISMLSKHILLNLKELNFGVCHGSRNGYEVNKLKEILKIDVIGTDISETCLKFPNMIVQDFHFLKNEWIDKCDFIYTNSLDHSYNPNLFIENNLKHLKKTGILYVQHSDCHVKATDKADCFGASLCEYIQLFNKYFMSITISDINSEQGIKQNRKLIICHDKKNS